jgi:response regulator NasT
MTQERWRIAVAAGDRPAREQLHGMLVGLGWQVVAVAAGQHLVELCQVHAPDLAVVDLALPDMDGVEAARAVNQVAAVPFVLLTDRPDGDLAARAGGAPIAACLVKPVSDADLRAAVPLALHSFRQWQALAGEAAALRQTLEDRKLSEKAKGVLIKRLGIDEQVAFRRLRSLASSQNRKLLDVCRQVIAADELLNQFAQIP